MVNGIVKWFKTSKGFGLIEKENSGPDVFTYDAAINSTDFKSLNVGDKVTFNIEPGQKGYAASNVAVICPIQTRMEVRK